MTKHEKEKGVEVEVEGKSKSTQVSPRESLAERSARAAVIKALLLETSDRHEIPASELGAPREGLPGSEVNLTSFELMTVSGADAEQINTYLEREARQRFRKELKDLSDEQYDKLLSDKVKFHQWMAKAWVESFIRARKDEVRIIADKRSDSFGSKGGVLDFEFIRYGVGDPLKEWQEPLSRPEAAGVSKERRVVLEAKRCLAREVMEKREQLQKLKTSLEEQHAAMIETQRSQLEAQGLDEKMITSVVDTLRASYESTRKALVAEQEVAIKAFQETAETELKARALELEAEAETLIASLKSGTKREMVLAVDRWGRLLSKIARANPSAIKRNNETGAVSLDFLALNQEGREYVMTHIDKELDRVLGAQKQEKDAVTSLQRHNLDSLFRTEEEQAFAFSYSRILRDRIVRGSHKPKEVKRFHLIFGHLREKGLVDPMEALYVEANIGPAFEEQRLDYPTALKEVRKYLEEYDGTSIDLCVKTVVQRLTRILEEGKAQRSKWLDFGYRDHLSDYGALFADLVETIEQKNKGATRSLTASTPWFEFAKVLREVKGNFFLLSRVMPAVYRIHTENKVVLSEVRGYYVLPSELIKDFMDTSGTRVSGYDIMVRETVDQMRIHFRRWSRSEGGREQVRQAIWKIADQIKTEIKGNFDDMVYRPGEYKNAADFVGNIENGVSSIQYCFDLMKTRLEILKQLATEF